MRKKYLQTIACVLPILSLYGCTVEIPFGETDMLKLSENASYYSNYITEREDMVFRVKGRVHLHEKDADVICFTAKKDSDIMVLGDVERADENVKLVYAASDGAETILVEGIDEEIDVTLAAPEGAGKIYFTGEGACDFSLKIKAGEGVIFDDQEEMDLEESEKACLKDISEDMELEESLEFPGLTDNWPENILLEDEGMTAKPLMIGFQVEEEMEVLLSCITTGGDLELRIVSEEEQVYFEEEDPQGEYEVTIDAPGTYYLAVYARDHRGSISMKPIVK